MLHIFSEVRNENKFSFFGLKKKMYICISIFQHSRLKNRATERVTKMDKKQFTALLASPAAFSSQDRGWLRAMSAKYPQSAAVALMALLADRAYHFDTPDERRAVELALAGQLDLDALLARASQAADDRSFDIFSEINTYQEVSFKTAPKSVILSNFLQTAGDENLGDAPDGPIETEAKVKKSLIPDQSIGTETLAVILEKQGKFDQALQIYRNLLAANPEKSSTFAPRIERLEALVGNE